MFDQQLDFDGGAHDLAPKHEQPRMFEFPQTSRGQLALEAPHELKRDGFTVYRKAGMRPFVVQHYA